MAFGVDICHLVCWVRCLKRCSFQRNAHQKGVHQYRYFRFSAIPSDCKFRPQFNITHGQTTNDLCTHGGQEAPLLAHTTLISKPVIFSNQLHTVDCRTDIIFGQKAVEQELKNRNQCQPPCHCSSS